MRRAARLTAQLLDVAPIVLPLLVASLSTLFYYGEVATALAEQATFLQRDAYNLPVAQPQIFVGHGVWLVAEFSFLLVLLVCFGSGLVVLNRYGRPVEKGVVWLLLLLTVGGLVGARLYAYQPLFTPPYTRVLAATLEDLGVPVVNYLNTTSVLMIGAFLASAAAAAALSRPDESATPDDLARRGLYLRLLLGAFSLLLVCGTLEVYAFHRIPVRLLGEPQRSGMIETAALIGVLNGVLASAIIVALFGPALWRLVRTAHLAARGVHFNDRAAQHRWLDERGLGRESLALLRTVLAFAAPLGASLASYFLALK